MALYLDGRTPRIKIQITLLRVLCSMGNIVNQDGLFRIITRRFVLVPRELDLEILIMTKLLLMLAIQVRKLAQLMLLMKSTNADIIIQAIAM